MQNMHMKNNYNHLNDQLAIDVRFHHSIALIFIYGQYQFWELHLA